MRGREAAWREACGLLRSVEAGESGTLLVDGKPGIGKTRLLTETTAAASARGITVLEGSAEELGEFVPCGVLFDVLALRPEPGADSGDVPVGVEWRARALERLRMGFEWRATGPTLAVLDDLHWAGQATLIALRTLHHDLVRYPIGWLLSRSTTVRQRNPTTSLFDLLERGGATRVTLGPLPADAVMAMTTEALGAPPEPPMVELVAAAGGNPLLITELLAGLRDEGLLTAVGHATGLSYAHVPDRFRMVVRRWIDALSAGARNLIETAAVLGPTFTPQEVASLLGSTPAALLPLVEESMAAGLLAVTAHGLAFRQELLGLVVAAQVPQPVRRALLTQVTGSAHSPPGRSQFDARIDTTLTSIDTAVAAGRLEEAEHAARGHLTGDGSAQDLAEARCVMSDIMCLTGRLDEAVREAETALAMPGLTAGLRDRASVAWLSAMNQVGEGGASARAHAHDIVEEGSRHSTAATVAALMTLAAAERDEGRMSGALAFAEDARRLSGAEPVTHPYDSGLVSARMLIDLGMLDEAATILRDTREEMSLRGHLAWASDADVLEARAEFIAGRLDSAVTAADRAMGLATQLGTPLSAAAAGTVLAAVALRRGNLRAALRHLADMPPPDFDGRTRHALLTAQIAEMRDGPRSAMALISDLSGPLGGRRVVFAMEPTASAWMVRVALAVEDRPAAEAVGAVAESLSQANPEFPALVAAAEHARGLLDGDRDLLSRAAERTPDVWARASATEDLAVVLIAADLRKEAVRRLELALEVYQGIGSVRDSARVRHRLRGMGVRHRHWSYAERPVAGWDSLTETEHHISLLVADGWTNKHIAAQMFVSVHTVAFHLRHIYRKLHINSRVELTRLVAAEEHDDAGPPA
ncbi:helix-turn-helix transcriptional regulator [Thermoactinospora rubra]|uniref:helix-turn-helix transcriptional regulator n=1 Tax=Thermoactinospora rubra TaxID=1088767 RepID=UPI001301AE75|nr:LuxR C-terminal-related transcriptional regulator [Thermoactinospora rubra]